MDYKNAEHHIRVEPSKEGQEIKIMKGERQAICCLTLFLCFFENRKGIRKCVEFDKCKFVGFYFIGQFLKNAQNFKEI